MRILGIVGSTRRGNTYAMVESGCNALKDCEVVLMHLRDIKIQPCDGCLSCDQDGKCVIDDEMNAILPAITKAQGFIFGTPSRWSLLSGELKVFLDRLNPLAVPEILKGKKAIIFSVGQTKGEEAESIRLAVDSVRFFCDNAKIEVVDTVIAEGCVGPEDLIMDYPEILDRCKQAALKLYQSLLEE